MEWYEEEIPVGWEVIWEGVVQLYKRNFIISPDRKTFDYTVRLLNKLYGKAVSDERH